MVKRRVVISRWADVEYGEPFVPHVAAQQLRRLSRRDRTALILDDAYLTAVVVDKVGARSEPTKLQVLALRRHEDRPAAYSPGGQLAPIDLPGGYYTADVTYVVLWPDGIAAQDYHGDAPRLTRLAHYLRRKVGASVTFESLYNPDVADRLQDIAGQMRSVDIALTGQHRSAQDRGLFGTLVPAAFGERAPSVRIKVGMGRYGPRDRFLDPEIQEVALRLAEQASELVDRMVVRGRSRVTGKTITLDLLKERLGEEVDMPPGDEGGSFPAARTAYRELERVRGHLAGSGALDGAVRAQLLRGTS